MSDTARNILAREIGGTSSGLYVQAPDYEAYAGRMRGLLRNIKASADAVQGRVTAVGLAAPMVQELVTKLIREVLGEVTCVFTSEAAVALACHDLTSGVSLVAGTGASCVALNEQGEGAGCGGFGPQFGDEGSGYWIGREAIAAAMREKDGRGPKTALSPALCAFYGIGHIAEIYIPGSGRARVRAEGGMMRARRLKRRVRATRSPRRCAAARAMRSGHTIVATVQRAGLVERPVPVVLTGGVFNGGALILTPLKRVLRRSGIAFRVFPVVTEPGGHIQDNRTTAPGSFVMGYLDSFFTAAAVCSRRSARPSGRPLNAPREMSPPVW